MALAMDAPPVQYVTTSDGYNIAYAVTGEGRPVVLLPNMMNHVQLLWQHPLRRALFEALGSRFRLIQFDGRGMGLSARGLQEGHWVGDHARDLEAVVRRLDIDRYVILAEAGMAYPAVLAANEHTANVEALVLRNPGWDHVDVLREAFSLTKSLPADPGSYSSKASPKSRTPSWTWSATAYHKHPRTS